MYVQYNSFFRLAIRTTRPACMYLYSRHSTSKILLALKSFLFSSYPQMTIDLFKQVIFTSHLYLYIKSHIYTCMDPEVETYLELIKKFCRSKKRSNIKFMLPLTHTYLGNYTHGIRILYRMCRNFTEDLIFALLAGVFQLAKIE